MNWLAGWDRSTGSIEVVERPRTLGDGCRCSTPHRYASTERPESRERSSYRTAAVSVCGGIQPGTLRKAIGTEHRENGLLARMLLAYPPSRARRWSEAAIRKDSVEPFMKLLRSLRKIEFERDRSGELVSGIVELSQTAKNLFRDFYNEHAKEQETLDDDLAAAWSKLEEYAARLELIIHVCRHASGDTVSEREVDEVSIEAGIELTRWFCRETRRVYAALEQSESERASHELADRIRRKGGEVSVPDVQGGHRRFRTSAEAETLWKNSFLSGWDSGNRSPPPAVADARRDVSCSSLSDCVHETLPMLGNSEVSWT